MLTIQESPRQDNKEVRCRKCNDSGKSSLFRGDWEDYDG